jgi:hypothetical protein
LSFNVPTLVQQAATGWAQGPSESDTPFEDSIQAILSSTNDPSVYQLSQLDTEDLWSHPQGEIEVSLGQMPLPGPDAFNFDDFDFSSFLSQIQSEPALMTAQESRTLAQDLSTLLLDKSFEQPQRDFSSSDSSIFQYVNLDSALRDDDPSASAYPTPSPQEDQNESNSSACVAPAQTTYTPPAGAMFSSTRRVAASWKPSFTAKPESPVDHSPPRQWGVPAS